VRAFWQRIASSTLSAAPLPLERFAREILAPQIVCHHDRAEYPVILRQKPRACLRIVSRPNYIDPFRTL
jgi:hypothetical protein